MTKLCDLLGRLEEGTLAVGLLALAVLSFCDVVGRYLFNHSLVWLDELSRFLLVSLVFLGASLGVRRGAHFSMDFLAQRVPARAAVAMRLLGDALGAVLMIAVAYFAWRHALKLLGFGVISPALRVPMFYAYLPVAFFSLAMGLRLLAEARRHARELRSLPVQGGRPR